MQIFARTFDMTTKGSRANGRATENGIVSLTLRKQGDGSYRFTLVGKKLDLSALDTGNPDVTVAFVVGDAQFVRNRNLVLRKATYALPKKRKR
jgi:hypothetical protein